MVCRRHPEKYEVGTARAPALRRLVRSPRVRAHRLAEEREHFVAPWRMLAARTERMAFLRGRSVRRVHVDARLLSGALHLLRQDETRRGVVVVRRLQEEDRHLRIACRRPHSLLQERCLRPHDRAPREIDRGHDARPAFCREKRLDAAERAPRDGDPSWVDVRERCRVRDGGDDVIVLRDQCIDEGRGVLAGAAS